MDTLCHTARGFLLGLTIQGWELAVIGGACEAWVDLWSEYKAHTSPRLENGKKDYAVYNKIHDGEHWSRWIPFVTDHIAFDKLGHGKDKEWYPARWFEYFMPVCYRQSMWLETQGWIVNILLGLNIFFKLT